MFLQTVATRFGRVFLAGAIAQALAATAAAHSVTTLKDLEQWAYMLLVSAIAGGLAAVDKALRWEE
jgi:hypothetical protein